MIGILREELAGLSHNVVYNTIVVAIHIMEPKEFRSFGTLM